MRGSTFSDVQMSDVASRVLAFFLLLLGFGCAERPGGWFDETHGKDVAPNYELLFAMDRVHELRLVIAAPDYQALEDDLAQLLGEVEAPTDPSSTSPPPPPQPPPPAALLACQNQSPRRPCAFEIDGSMITGRCAPDPNDTLVCVPDAAAMPNQGSLSKFSRDPMYVPVELHYEGHVWQHVGLRYKGNSSLASSRQRGIEKLSFRLNFDRFEDDYPNIHDQRFHGFRELTFSSNWGDNSQLRECFTKEIFRDRGVPAPRCAFYRVQVDVGNGSTYWGLYSAVEDPDDGAMLDSQFGGRGGNLYKPEGAGADFTHFESAAFVKKTNEEAADWSDVELAIEALHSQETVPERYRSNLETYFDAPLFINWLAVNTVIYNWDTYGRGAHNYYLYADPGRGGQLRWIPWDHNLAMMLGQPGRETPPRPSEDAASARQAIFHSRSVDAWPDDAWPLISRLLNDSTYAAQYRRDVENALAGLFAETSARARLQELHDLISPHVIGETGEREPYSTIAGEQDFENSVDGPGGLGAHVASRHRVVRLALDSP